MSCRLTISVSRGASESNRCVGSAWASSASRSTNGDMVLDLGGSPWVHQPIRPLVPPFPPVGPGATGSPRSAVLWSRKTPPTSIPRRLRSPLPRGTPARTEETRRSPRFLGNPCEHVPRARDSGGPRRTSRVPVRAVQPSAGLTASAPTTTTDFGAEPSRPAFSLSTLHLAGHPTQVQDSLPACPLRR